MEDASREATKELRGYSRHFFFSSGAVWDLQNLRGLEPSKQLV